MTKKTQSEGKTLEEANNINKRFRLIYSFNSRIEFNEHAFNQQLDGSRLLHRFLKQHTKAKWAYSLSGLAADKAPRRQFSRQWRHADGKMFYSSRFDLVTVYSI